MVKVIGNSKFLTKLVILRGNSGSGKSTVAKILREKIDGKVAIVEQDYFRRFVLKEKGVGQTSDNIGLIKQTVEYAQSRNYLVILEGILHLDRYKKMLYELVEDNKNSLLYYFDISLKETLKRHDTKPNAHEFGEKELREWYKPQDFLGLENERIISENQTLSETVDMILGDIRL